MFLAVRKPGLTDGYRVLLSLMAAALFAVAVAGPVRADDDDDEEKFVRDTFRDAPGTRLSLHEPNSDSVGGGWITGIGTNFQIASDGRSARDADLNLSSKIAVIDSQVSEFDLSVTVIRSEPSTLTGVVFRYVDADNYMAAVHKGKRLRLIKVVAGAETELARRSFRSKSDSGDLWTVSVRHGDVQVAVNGKRRLRTSDPAFADATYVGLIQQPSQRTAFTDFRVESDDEDDDEDDDRVRPPDEKMSPPVVSDSFTATDGTDLGSHTGTEITSGGGWTAKTGGWEISGGAVSVATPDPARPSGDHIVFIPSEDAPLQEISADITWHGGFAGLAWNVGEGTTYSLAFWDGFSIVIGRVEAGMFRERGRQLASWTPGQTRNLRIRLQDGHAFAYLDDSEPILLAFGIEEPSVLNAGLFDRFNAGNTFDNFVVRTSPDSDLPRPFVPDPPIVPPGTGDPPPDAWLFDSFNSPDFSLLRHRTPEIDPSGEGWTDVDGFWMLLQAQASEQSGVFGPGGFDRFAVIDTGADEYELKSKVRWDGGRVGVLFGGRSTGTDDAGRNGFIFFRRGDFLHAGQLIGGVYFGIDITDDFKWQAGRTRTMRVEVEEGEAKLKLNGKTVFKFSDPALEGSTWAGIFQRGESEERYNDFTVELP